LDITLKAQTTKEKIDKCCNAEKASAGEGVQFKHME